jgi:hypothetical protein
MMTMDAYGMMMVSMVLCENDMMIMDGGTNNEIEGQVYDSVAAAANELQYRRPGEEGGGQYAIQLL